MILIINIDEFYLYHHTVHNKLEWIASEELKKFLLHLKQQGCMFSVITDNVDLTQDVFSELNIKIRWLNEFPDVASVKAIPTISFLSRNYTPYMGKDETLRVSYSLIKRLINKY